MDYLAVIRKKNKILCIALLASIVLRGIVNAVFMGIQAVVGLVIAGLVLTGILLLLAAKIKPVIMMYLMVFMMSGISIACMIVFPSTTNYLMFFLAIFMIVIYEDIRPIALQSVISAISMVVFYFRYQKKLAESWSEDAMAMCIVYIVSAMFVLWALCRLTGQQFTYLETVNAESIRAKNKAENLLLKIKKSVKTLDKARITIKDSIGITEEISGQITIGVKDVSRRAENEVNAVETIQNMVREGVEQIQNVANSSLLMTNISNETSNSVAEGGSRVQELNIKMRELNEKMDAIAYSITELNEENEKIIEILQTLDGITSQTNLLSLNASIEAARAGEHGKGFSVVATEIRKLSEDSSKFTDQIHEILEGINQRTRQVKEEIGQGQEFVSVCSQNTSQVDLSFRSIAENTNQVLTQAKQIEEGSASLVTLLEHTRENVKAISENVEETSAAMEEIQNSIQSLNRNVDSVVDGYQNMNEITGTLVSASIE